MKSNVERIAEAHANPRLLEAAVQRAVRAAVLDHARDGHSVPTMRDGQVVWLTPAEIFAFPPLQEENETPAPTP